MRLPDFRIPLNAADEETLAALEAMVLSGELGVVTLDEIRARLSVTPVKLQTLLAVLAERKKIVEGTDGFILHSEGYVVTNAHVAARAAKLTVIFADRTEHEADPVAIDERRRPSF